ncbi:hypothetical protein ALC57_10831 [Trachymyrmex cornetzi]|uniref:Uncharacterized protein n=1 Tax=Trachymyrmex cornetzi TaxID=471704 RepID=A0A195DVS8_9HYME|nr:hypothetical protein ALC57_10831 [Trachymyrmex cornetzi]
MIAAPNDTALATRLQLFCGTLDTRVTSPPVSSHALASIRRLYALDNPRNAPVAAVDLREVTLQSRPLPGVGERSVFRIEIFTTWSRQRNTVNRLIPIVNAVSIRCNVTASEFYCKMEMENPFNN